MREERVDRVDCLLGLFEFDEQSWIGMLERMDRTEGVCGIVVSEPGPGIIEKEAWVRFGNG